MNKNDKDMIYMIRKYRKSLMIMATLFSTLAGNAQNTALPAPDKTGGATMMEALWNRKACREFSDRSLTEQQLANLLWAATGMNRPDEGRRTNATAVNMQEVSVYAVMPGGICLYDHATHALQKVADGDHRQLVAAGQDFVNDAPVSLVIVVDMGKFGDRQEMMRPMGAADAGIVAQNISLFCAATGLATVIRGTMDREALQKLLGLNPGQEPMLNCPVGYARQH